jgi:peptidylprolyl isomerase
MSTQPTKVKLQTSKGNIVIQLRIDKPITAGNFKKLIEKGTYNGTIFHRVIANFMIQGGDPTGTGYGDDSIPTILDEIGCNNRNARGTIAMAKTCDPDSASSQFFINLVDNGRMPGFDPTYAVFGEVVEGMDVVDAISQVATNKANNDRPLQNVKIVKAQVLP